MGTKTCTSELLASYQTVPKLKNQHTKPQHTVHA